jgi:hypothetical protein
MSEHATSLSAPKPARGRDDFVQSVALGSVSTGVFFALAALLLWGLLTWLHDDLVQMLGPGLRGTPLWEWYDPQITNQALLATAIYGLALIPVSLWLPRGGRLVRNAFAFLMLVAVVGHIAAGVVLHIAGLKLMGSFPGIFDGLPWFLPVFVLLNVGTIGLSAVLFAWVGWRVYRMQSG